MIRVTVFAFAAAMLVITSSAAQAPLGNRGRDGDTGIRGDRMVSGTGGASRIINVDPADRYRDGVNALTAGNYRDAQRAFREVLSQEARDPSTNFLMGVSLANDTTSLKLSRSYFERAVRYKNDFTEARGWLGVAFAKTGEAEKANEQKTTLADLKNQCAAACAEAGMIDAALKSVEDAIANPAAPLPALPKIAATYGEAPF